MYNQSSWSIIYSRSLITKTWSYSLSWLERSIHIREVPGSSPGTTTLHYFFHPKHCETKKTAAQKRTAVYYISQFTLFPQDNNPKVLAKDKNTDS